MSDDGPRWDDPKMKRCALCERPLDWDSCLILGVGWVCCPGKCRKLALQLGGFPPDQTFKAVSE